MKKYLLLIAFLLLLPYVTLAATGKVLLVGGGGGAGANDGGGGGGGAGSVEYFSAFPLYATTYTITIGAGGNDSAAGGNSTIATGTTITAYGGGGGAQGNAQSASSGGSGGGGSHSTRDAAAAGSGSNVFGGGAKANNDGGGGGGAGATGNPATAPGGGNGGAGIADASVGNLLTDPNPDVGVGGFIAGGGGGGSDGSNGGAGGSGGGGQGASSCAPGYGTDGATSTGSGAGGSGGCTGEAVQGGSGISVWEFATADYNWSTTTTTGTNRSGTIGANTWIVFTSNDTLTFSATGASPVATTTLQNLNFTYDLVGNITQLADLSGTNGYQTADYVYDGLYRLTSASTTLGALTNWVQTYTYDLLGNLTAKSDVGSYTYAGTGFTNPHAATVIGASTYAYDKAGNLTSSGNGTATTTHTWNYRDRLTDTNDGGGSTATTTHYAYDHNDLRVQMDVKRGSQATTTTKTFNQYYDVTTQGSNSTTTLNIYLPDGTLLATVEGNGSATSTSVIHTDHLGGTNVVSNETGSQRQLNNYYPYGAKRIDEKPPNGSPQTRQFIGQKFDESTSLSYLQNRYYFGTNGQFTSQDPLVNALGTSNTLYGRSADLVLANPQELNTYSYGLNNPINKSDPNGTSAAGIPLSPFEFALIGLFSPIQGSYDPVYEASQYAEQNSITNAVMGTAMNMSGGKGGRALNAEGRLINAVNGARREAQEGQELARQNPGSDVLGQRTLLNADGTKAVDPKTGIGRRIDFAVVKNGQIINRVEVTSQTASKNSQLRREERIINSGGTFIRGSDGGLINFANQTGGVTTPAVITRRPRRKIRGKMNRKKLPLLDPKYVIDNWKNTLHHYRHNTHPGLSEWEIERMKYSWFLYYKFFQDHGLTTRKLVDTPTDMESLIVYAGDFTPEGEKIDRLANAEERYSNALDRGTEPERAIKILERDLKKLQKQ